MTSRTRFGTSFPNILTQAELAHLESRTRKPQAAPQPSLPGAGEIRETVEHDVAERIALLRETLGRKQQELEHGYAFSANKGRARGQFNRER